MIENNLWLESGVHINDWDVRVEIDNKYNYYKLVPIKLTVAGGQIAKASGS